MDLAEHASTRSKWRERTDAEEVVIEVLQFPYDGREPVGPDETVVLDLDHLSERDRELLREYFAQERREEAWASKSTHRSARPGTRAKTE